MTSSWSAFPELLFPRRQVVFLDPFSRGEGMGVKFTTAVSTDILHFRARVVVFTCPDRFTAAAPRLLRALFDRR